jgi:DNA repair protein RadC
VHNHPSGDPTPSAEDRAMTEQIREAAALLAIEVQDHIIVGNGRWLSFRAQGLLV